jgi:hypothetical protein
MVAEDVSQRLLQSPRIVGTRLHIVTRCRSRWVERARVPDTRKLPLQALRSTTSAPEAIVDYSQTPA